MKPRYLSSAGLLLALTGTVHGQGPPAKVISPLHFVVDTGIDRANKIIGYTQTVVVPVYREEIVVVDGKEVRQMTTGFENVKRDGKFALKGGKVLDAKGKELPEDEVWKRVKPGSAVLVSVFGPNIEPAYLRILRDDAVILVLPQPPPAPPVPPPPVKLPPCGA
jgi:hypothetical protein